MGIVVVYMDEEFDPDECEACNVDDLSAMGGEYEFCAYRVELPCEPVGVECGEPSAAPSDKLTEPPTIKPTVSPTIKPTASPTNKPTVSPTPIPTEPSTVAPTPCPPDDPILIDIEGTTMY